VGPDAAGSESTLLALDCSSRSFPRWTAPALLETFSLRWQTGWESPPSCPKIREFLCRLHRDPVETDLRFRERNPFFEAVSLEFLAELRERGWQVYSYPRCGFLAPASGERRLVDPGEYPDVEWKKRKKFAFPTVPRLNALLRERTLLSHGRERKRRNSLQQTAGGPCPEDGSPGFLPPGPLHDPDGHDGEGASQPLLQEISGLIPRVYWKPWAEMHPERAKTLSLEDGNSSAWCPGKDPPSCA